MITSLALERLRGVRAGRLDGLRPLSVLVGPAGGGKSAALEGLLMAGARDARLAADLVTARRGGTSGYANLAFHQGAEGEARISLGVESGEAREVVVGAGGVIAAGEGPGAWLFDGRAPESALVEAAFASGRAEAVAGLVREVAPGLDALRWTGGAVEAVLDGRPLPLALCGDGVAGLARLALGLAGCEGGLALVEEPEARQHPAVIFRTARALAEAARRGVQVVVSTHSRQLLADLLSPASGLELSDVAVFRLRLREGRMDVSRFSGADAAFALVQLEDDLR